MNMINKFRSMLKAGFIGLMCIAVIIPVFADTDSENAELARVLHIIDSLTPIINAAEQQRESQARIQFQYDWLRADIRRIKIGIEHKINLAGIEPRVVQPLKGDFVTQDGHILTVARTGGEQ